MTIELPLPAHLSDYRWRPARMDDASAIFAMLMAGEEIDQPFTLPSVERVRYLYGLLGERLEQNTLLALGSDGDVVAEAFIYFPPGEENFHLAMVTGHVHMQQRRRGLGSFLLSWLEERARQEFGKPEDGIAQLLRTSCAAHQSDRITLFEKHGFTAARYSYTMQRDLERLPPTPSLPANVELLPWSPALDGAAMRAFRAAFQGQWGVPQMTPELWQEFFTGVPQFHPELSCLALAGGEVVGFCVNWVKEPSQGWIEALGVLREWRGSGVATALLTHSLQVFSKAGLDLAGLDVDAENPTGALRLYKKLGFEAVKEDIHFAKQLT
jgi:mycothiol synthase